MNLIMAHRGWSSRAPENTIAAIKLVLKEEWINSIEIDVQMTKDGVPVLIHDFRVDRTTDGQGYVKEMTLMQLKNLDAGSWFGEQFRGEKIPTLAEVLKLCKGKKRLNIELKTAGEMYEDLAEKVVNLIERFGMEKEVIITSFDHIKIKQVKQLNSSIVTGLIIEGNPPLLDEQLHCIGATVISMSYLFLTKDFVRKQLAGGRKIIVWTPNSMEEIYFVKQFSSEIEICTNYPERGVSIN